MKKNFDGIDLYFVTYPRAGKTWLDWYLKNNTNIKALYTHNILKESNGLFPYYDPEDYKIIQDAEQNKDKIVSIVRNPLDSLVSINIMENFRHMDERYFQYINHYEYILKNCNTLFLFEDVVKKTKQVSEYLCNKFSKKFTENDNSFENYSKWHTETKNPQQLITSKIPGSYQEAIEKIKKMNLVGQNYLYKKAKERCVIF